MGRYFKTGLESTKKRLTLQNLEGHLIKCDMKMLPYVDSCFDALICLHAIYHQRLNEIQITASEIERVLKKAGSVLINFLSKRTYSYRKGEMVEGNTFMEQDGIGKVFHHFTDREEIKCLFKNFNILNLRLNEEKIEGKRQSRWILVATV